MKFACAVAFAFVVSTSAFAQQDFGACSKRCGDTMVGCMNKCNDPGKCAEGCQNRMNECTNRCQAAPEKSAKESKLKGQKCVGADGKRIACPDYKATKAPKEKPDDPNDQYPNKAAKDLMKDPNFKGAEGLQ